MKNRKTVLKIVQSVYKGLKLFGASSEESSIPKEGILNMIRSLTPQQAARDALTAEFRWSGLLTCVGIAGFLSVSYCPVAQAADWSTNMGGPYNLTLECNVKNITTDVIGQWTDIYVVYSVPAIRPAVQEFGCHHKGDWKEEWRFRCAGKAFQIGKLADGKSVSISREYRQSWSEVDIYLRPVQATQQQACRDLFNGMGLSVQAY